MGNYQAANSQTTVASPVTALAFLHHLCITFVPSTSGFLTGFEDSVQSWMFVSPATNKGLVAELQPANWQSRLKSLGATPDEPVWRAVDAHFKQLKVADSSGARDSLQLTDKVFIGRRTRAAPSLQTVTFTTNAAGTVRVKVNQAKYIHADETPAGSLADVVITADGVLTVAQLATALDAALTAVPGFTAAYTVVATLGAVAIESIADGYPLTIDLLVSSGGPTMTLDVDTANVAGDYQDDLDDIQEAAEFGTHLDPPARQFFWLTDLQADDVVSLEGMAWQNVQKTTQTPPRDYFFWAWATSGGKVIDNAAGDPSGNFDPTATGALSQLAAAALGDEGYPSSITDHDRWEFVVPALLGRTIGYMPGEVSFTSKVLFGSVADARMTGRDFGDNEILAKDRNFSWYSAEGPRGAHKYAATSNGSFADRYWLEAYCTYLTQLRLVEWMQLRDIVTYSDDDIAAARSVVADAIAELPAVNSATINVTFLTRAQVNPDDIANRVYSYFASFADTLGIINQIGTSENPITITLTDAG